MSIDHRPLAQKPSLASQGARGTSRFTVSHGGALDRPTRLQMYRLRIKSPDSVKTCDGVVYFVGARIPPLKIPTITTA
jgi:hypothetical protein